MLLLNGNARCSPEVLGNKGCGIDLMRRQSLPVPSAFGIGAEVGARYLAEPGPTMDAIWDDVLDGMRWLEVETSSTFGRGAHPLLVSVRSGAAQSMPGMMDTLLNLGINDAVEAALAATSSPEFAADTHRRFTRMYRHVVAGELANGRHGTAPMPVPTDPYEQLRAGIEAVFASWHSPRAVAYRAHHRLDERSGTAVIVQAMVFGNRGTNSGAGVLCSRNPITGSAEPFGEWLPGGQGDDVVSGLVNVQPIGALRDTQPAAYAQLMAAAGRLERLAADIQEIEFTVEDGTLWLLQTRAAERSAQAAVRLALQLRREGLINDVETLRRVNPAHVEALTMPSLQPETRLTAPLLATGLAACPGVVSGRAYTDVDEALRAAERGEEVILVRGHTRPDDILGMVAARGVVTEVGGASSHAAVVSRELGRVAVVGCGNGAAAALAGKQITVDGTEGEVRAGTLKLSAWSESDTPELRELAAIARRVSPLRAHSAGEYPRLESSSDTEVRNALAAGHTDVVSGAPLVTMLTAMRAAGRDAPTR
ncbi:pyruvate, phosphate dikinase [Mycobacterium basiliense]|uniref:pyruvate, phosphate dikinase n=1 Tax=Mycobacterium basiliense TaxID=2094119 RepID=UPI001300DDA9|nr:pyruvate, phosphate dikinase [Mycobacterium basiliense]